MSPIISGNVQFLISEPLCFVRGIGDRVFTEVLFVIFYNVFVIKIQRAGSVLIFVGFHFLHFCWVDVDGENV